MSDLKQSIAQRPLSRRQALKLMGGAAGVFALAACAAPVPAPGGDGGECARRSSGLAGRRPSP